VTCIPPELTHSLQLSPDLLNDTPAEPSVCNAFITCSYLQLQLQESVPDVRVSDGNMAALSQLCHKHFPHANPHPPPQVYPSLHMSCWLSRSQATFLLKCRMCMGHWHALHAARGTHTIGAGLHVSFLCAASIPTAATPIQLWYMPPTSHTCFIYPHASAQHLMF
jgi:hypothetical protein